MSRKIRPRKNQNHRQSGPAQRASAAQYPTAKAVPGKPGYVFSPYDPSGGYVDVNGYTPGEQGEGSVFRQDFFRPVNLLARV